MRALIQRVRHAKVEVAGKTIGQINGGLLVLLGVTVNDTDKEIDTLVEKIINVRIFSDEQDKMNLSILDTKGELLIVSQFTLYADCKGQRRPSFIHAAPRELAEDMYKKFIQKAAEMGLKVEQGEFGAMMDISLLNSGPVTIMLDTKEL